MSLLKNLSMTSGVFFVVFVLSLVSAQYDLELPPQSDLESIEEIQQLLRNVQLIFEAKMANKVREGKVPDDEEEDGENDVAVDPNGCNCQGLRCSCCKHISIPKINVNGTTCFTVTYLPQNYQIRVTLTYGARRLFSKDVTAIKPPKICVGIPFLKKGGSLCIQFYNLKVGQTSISGCARISGRFLYVTIAKINIGCFGIDTLNATQQGNEVDVPYLDE